MKKKIVLIYDSKYGYTKKYAQWIAEDISCSAFERKHFHNSDLLNYDTVIYGGGLYAGGISGLSFLTKNADILKDKQIILFTCGLADPEDINNAAHIKAGLDKVLPQELKKQTTTFHLQGGIDYSRLNLIHKMMMGMLIKTMRKKEPDSLRREDRLLLETYGKKIDFTDKTSIQPILDFLRE